MKKTKKKSEMFTLKIKKSIVQKLGIDETTKLEMIVVGDELIVKVKNKSIKNKQQKKRQMINDKLMDKYESVLKKLAKT